MYAIKTEKLTKKYKEKTAVSNLDLKINEGEMYGLLGVNGAGKTTTMKRLSAESAVALLTNLSAWFSNIWFDTAMVGGWFKNLANALPFAHAVNAARDAISGNYSDIMPELIPVCGYAVVLLVLAVVVFSVMMKGINN